jgi:hypothetical protein
MAIWLKDRLNTFKDFETEFIELTGDLPPVIKGRSRLDDPKKKTILLYNHYDVQPVSLFSLELFVFTFKFSRPAEKTNGILKTGTLSTLQNSVTAGSLVVGRLMTKVRSWVGLMF